MELSIKLRGQNTKSLEDYYEDEYEDNEMFGFLDLQFDDVAQLCDTPTEEFIDGYKDGKAVYTKKGRDMNESWEKALGETGDVDSISLSKTNRESFYFLLNLFCEIIGGGLDEDFNYLTESEFKELIKQREEKSLPVIIDIVFYTTM